MKANGILISVVIGIIGFVAGFMFANALNRRGEAPPVPDQPVANAQPSPAGADSLTPDEIAATIRAADQNPGNFSSQKNIGLSLYRYASTTKNADVLPDAIRILQRALDLDPADRDLVVALGNAHFDVGYFNKENESFGTARQFYKKALDRIPNDVDVRTDIALTYYLQEPPDYRTTIAEFEKGLAINPKHERSLQFLVQTYVKQNEIVKASQTLDRLKAANASNPAIPELMNMIAGGEPAVPR